MCIGDYRAENRVSPQQHRCLFGKQRPAHIPEFSQLLVKGGCPCPHLIEKETGSGVTLLTRVLEPLGDRAEKELRILHQQEGCVHPGALEPVTLPDGSVQFVGLAEGRGWATPAWHEPSSTGSTCFSGNASS